MKMNAMEKTAVCVMVSLGVIFAGWLGVSYADLLINGTEVSAFNIFHNLLG